MIAVTIEYKPSVFLPWRKLDTKFPALWSEMNTKQMEVVPLIQEGLLDETMQLQIFLGIKKSIARKIKGFNRYSILKNLKFLDIPEAHGSFIIDQILWYKRPLPLLKNVTFGAFIFGDTYYSSYLRGNVEDLDKFIACFYNDKLGFNEKKIEANANVIRYVRTYKREAIAVNYALIREWLAETYSYIFQKHVAGEKKKSGTGWVGVFDSLVGDDIINQDKYAGLPLSHVLRHLNCKIKDYYKNGGRV